MDFSTNYKIFLSKFYTFRWPLALLVVFLWLLYENSFSFSTWILCKLFLYPSTGSIRKIEDSPAGRTPSTPSDCQHLITISGFFCHSQICVLFFFPQYSISVPFLEMYYWSAKKCPGWEYSINSICSIIL